MNTFFWQNNLLHCKLKRRNFGLQWEILNILHFPTSIWSLESITSWMHKHQFMLTWHSNSVFRVMCVSYNWLNVIVYLKFLCLYFVSMNVHYWEYINSDSLILYEDYIIMDQNVSMCGEMSDVNVIVRLKENNSAKDV